MKIAQVVTRRDGLHAWYPIPCGHVAAKVTAEAAWFICPQCEVHYVPSQPKFRFDMWLHRWQARPPKSLVRAK